MIVRRPLLALALCFATMTACGVPTEDHPRTFTPPGGRSASAPSATTSAATGAPKQILYLVRDGRLVVVHRLTASDPTISQQLESLLAGPTESERKAGLTSALTGITVTGHVRLDRGQADVEIDTPPDGTGRSDEVLAYGQVVCTLTTRNDVNAVTFTHGGEPLGIPRADGSLAEGPLTAADYAALITT
ncbi:GerMN domain-containing protein [Dactylosporangium sp. NPDC049525]|uniref:GerMN domain-containing protein n=1 Tax=Dactylosporangium sp. NPDC049525 TaxID=3154730 RepID=UPI00341F758F